MFLKYSLYGNLHTVMIRNFNH